MSVLYVDAEEGAAEDDAHGGGHTEGRIHRGVHPRLLDPGHQGSLVGEHLVKNMHVLNAVNSWQIHLKTLIFQQICSKNDYFSSIFCANYCPAWCRSGPAAAWSCSLARPPGYTAPCGEF